MAGLVTHSRILVPTRNGEREIQLCLGDITRLPLDEKVDVILVSAFANDYASQRTTVIGALKYNLNVDVRKLNINHMKHDLRKNFHCWISKSLPDKVPYRQLLCFEKDRRGSQQRLLNCVQEIFRAMMPLFNNQSKTVITPLLATGMQNVDRSDMMNVMLKTAVNWMQMGLPLQTLKIVVFSKDAKVISSREKNCVDKFLSMKKVIEGKPPMLKEPSITTDVFVIHSKEDTNMANTLKNALQKEKKCYQNRLSTVYSIKTAEDTWQHDVFTAMLSSSRIVPLLSQSFLNSESCIDQFNVALCCNRFTRRDILASVCLERFNIPLYMGSVQWINCKERDIEKISATAKILQNQISMKSIPIKTKQYDIFISYCHRNTEKAKLLLSTLHDKSPDLKIFFDYAELKTGVSWQQTLYNSVDSSRCVLALVSPEYVKSLVCMEEFNIALSKHLSKSEDAKLVPVLIESCNEEVSAMLADFPVLDASGDKFDTCVPYVCNAVYEWLTNSTHDQQAFGPVMERNDIDLLAMKRRQGLFDKYYSYSKTDSVFQLNYTPKDESVLKSTSKTGCDLYISSSLWDQRYVEFIVGRLKKLQLNLTISDKLQNSESQITEARCILVLLSPNYLKSPKEVDELNFILSKERSLQGQRHLYVVRVNDLEAAATYVQLINTDTCLMDEMWEDFIQEQKDNSEDTMLNEDVMDLKASVVKEFKQKISEEEAVALLKAVCDLNSILLNAGYQQILGHQACIFHNIRSLNQVIDTEVALDDNMILPENMDSSTNNCNNVMDGNMSDEDVGGENNNLEEKGKEMDMARNTFFKTSRQLQKGRTCLIL